MFKISFYFRNIIQKIFDFPILTIADIHFTTMNFENGNLNQNRVHFPPSLAISQAVCAETTWGINFYAPMSAT
jgi:hypothetical protein